MIDPKTIKEHMDVIDGNGIKIGAVDRVEGEQMKLTRASGGGEHRYIPLSDIDHIDAHVHLKASASSVQASSARR